MTTICESLSPKGTRCTCAAGHAGPHGHWTREAGFQETWPIPWPDQLTVEALITELQRLVMERADVARMPVWIDDCGRCGCARLSALEGVVAVERGLIVGDRGVFDHEVPGEGFERPPGVGILEWATGGKAPR